MGWIDEQLAELEKNAKREIQSGAQSLSDIVRGKANEAISGPAPTPAAQVAVVAQSPAMKYVLIFAVVGVGAYFLMRSGKGKKG